MADEKRQLILDLLARNRMRKDTNDAADDLDKLGRAAEDADKKTEGLGRSSKKAEGETDKLGHSADDTRGKIAGLDKEIGNIQRELGTLARSFADTDDAASRLDISKAIRRTENDLRRVTKNRSILQDLLPDPGPAAMSWGKKLSQGINNSFAGDLASSSLLGTAGAVVGTTLAPEIGGLISAAVVGGVGLGGILGGIAAAASSDAEIKSYAGNIGKTFVAGIQEEGRNAFSGPIMDSLGKFEALASRSVGNVGKIFKAVAPSLAPLTDNVVRFADTLETSLVGAAQKSRPVLASLGNLLEDTGSSLGGFIDMAASHADEGASAVDDLNDALQNTIKVVTLTVDALATIKGGLDSFDSGIDKARYALEDHVGWLDLTADGYKKGSEAAQLYRDGVIGVAGSANDYDHYLAGAVDSTNALKDSHKGAASAADAQKEAEKELTDQLKAQTDPAFGLLDAIDKVHEAQKQASDSAHKYGKNSTEARDATRKLAEAAIDLQSKAGAAGTTLDGHLTPALEATLHSAGLTKSQIKNVQDELIRARKAAQAYAKDYKATITTYFISVTGTERLDPKGHRIGGYRAAGGPIVRGTPYIVGENGPEVVVPDSSGRVLNASASRGLMVQAGLKGMQGTLNGAGGGGGVAAVRLEAGGGSDQGVATLINYLIRTGKINATVAA